jgi:hypothetical protein
MATTAVSAIGPTIQHPEPTGAMTDSAIPARRQNRDASRVTPCNASRRLHNRSIRAVLDVRVLLNRKIQKLPALSSKQMNRRRLWRHLKNRPNRLNGLVADFQTTDFAPAASERIGGLVGSVGTKQRFAC